MFFKGYFLCACQHGEITKIEEVLNYECVDLSKFSDSAIYAAAKYEQLDVFNLLWHFDSVREYYERY